MTSGGRLHLAARAMHGLLTMHLDIRLYRSEQVQKISKVFRLLRDEKTLPFLRLLAHGGRALPASRQPTSPASISPPSERVEKISKFFRFLRDEKTLSFLRLLTHGGSRLSPSRQAPPPASMSPPSEQVEKISKFFRFLTQHLCSASLCVYLHHRLVTCSFQPATACDRSGARDRSSHRRGGKAMAAAAAAYPGTRLP